MNSTENSSNWPYISAEHFISDEEGIAHTPKEALDVFSKALRDAKIPFDGEWVWLADEQPEKPVIGTDFAFNIGVRLPLKTEWKVSDTVVKGEE